MGWLQLLVSPVAWFGPLCHCCWFQLFGLTQSCSLPGPVDPADLVDPGFWCSGKASLSIPQFLLFYLHFAGLHHPVYKCIGQLELACIPVHLSTICNPTGSNAWSFSSSDSVKCWFRGCGPFVPFLLFQEHMVSYNKVVHFSVPILSIMLIFSLHSTSFVSMVRSQTSSLLFLAW